MIKKCSMDLNQIVHKETIDYLKKNGIENISDLLKKIEEQFYWGKISENIILKDRIELERILLNCCSIDAFRYYYCDNNSYNRIYKYKHRITDGNLISKTSPHICYEEIMINRLSRKICIYLKTDLNDEYMNVYDIPYKENELFFENALDHHQMKNIYAIAETIKNTEIELTHLSEDKEVYGSCVIDYGGINETPIFVYDLLNKTGIDLRAIKDNLESGKLINNYTKTKTEIHSKEECEKDVELE